MLNLYQKNVKKKNSLAYLSKSEILSIKYHSFFDFPLNFTDLVRWSASPSVDFENKYQIKNRNGYYFSEGKEGSVYKRLLHKRISDKKMEIAKKAARKLSFIPSIKMIAITGSLAMENSNEASDIDLMIITKSGNLWITRALTYLLISIFGIQKRRPMDKDQKDKLCLNMWLDESDLSWAKTDRNIYTAHEIAQIVPLVNKDKTYEKFISKNKWILDYWPNAVSIKNLEFTIYNSEPNFIEKIAYKLQYSYMKKKISREFITKTRALFHPQDWGKIILQRLAS